MKTYPFDAGVVADAVMSPPLADLAARADRRTRRRRAVGSGLAAAALVAVALMAPALRPDAEPPAGPATNEPGAFFTDTVAVDQRTVVSVRWSQCAVAVSVTTDAGATWTPYRGPTTWRACGIPTGTFYELLGPRRYAAEIEGVRYLSHDAGVTWQRRDARFTLVDTLPPGTEPRRRGAGGQGVDPTTGDLYQLRSAPVNNLWDTRQAPDGSLWMVGTNSLNRSPFVDQAPVVVRSPDRGRSWQPTGPLPAIATDPILVPAGPQDAYLLARQDGRPTLYRTTDGGRNWTHSRPPWSSALAATIGTDGALIVYGAGPTGPAAWAGRDHGRSFEPAARVPVANPRAGATIHGLIWVTGDDGSIHLTVDGRTWQRIPPPR